MTLERGSSCDPPPGTKSGTRSSVEEPRNRKAPPEQGFRSSPGWTRTNNPPVNSRMLCQLSYRGRQPADCTGGSRAIPGVVRDGGAWLEDAGRTPAARRERTRMRRFAVVCVAVSVGFLALAPGGLAASARVAALQIAVRAHGVDPGPIDGVAGPEDARRARRLPAPARTRPRREAGAGDAEGARRARSAASRPARARARRRGLGRRGARVPAPEVRASRREPSTDASPERRRPRSAATSGATAWCPTGSPARTRIASSRSAGLVRTHVVSAGRELLLDRGALPREPVAARAGERAHADAG